MGFVLLLGGLALAEAQTIIRGPYLQQGTDNSIIVKWRTNSATDSKVNYGLSAANINQSVTETSLTTEHEIEITGLTPYTQYYYSVGNSSVELAGDSSYVFRTSPSLGNTVPARIWVIGDSGTANSNARAVRDAFKDYYGSAETQLWLMLGDNAYNSGTDSEYQAAVFDTYPELLRQIPLWSTLGNHDGQAADSATQTGPYYDIFSFPKNAQAGGVASGTEAYYSFEYSNIHFVVLDSYETDRSTNGAMLTWLQSDLAVNQKDWVIAFWHHPPYTKGSHNSDTEGNLIDMRQNALPLLELWGVDLVLSGHSHSYERSYLIDGHYGSSSTFDPESHQIDGGDGRVGGDGAYSKSGNLAAPNEGAVYAVAGSSGLATGGSLNHPAMFISLNELGSMVLDVNGSQLDAKFLDSSVPANVLDSFTISKGPDLTAPTIVSAQAIDATTVSVDFSEPVEQFSAENTGNYAIDIGVIINNATLQANGTTVHLDTSALIQSVVYTLTINNIADTSLNTIAPNSQTQFDYSLEFTNSYQNGSGTYSGTRDTYIAQGSNGSNFGNSNTLLLDGDDGGGNDLATLIAWDISDIPVTATIESATMTLEVFDPSGSVYNVFELKQPWIEGQATWQEYATGSSWVASGALGTNDRGSNVLGSLNNPGVGSNTVHLNIAGIDLIQAWVNGGKPNNGFVIANSSSSDGVDIRSSEYATAAQRPGLTVIYTLPIDAAPPGVPGNLLVMGTTAGSVSLSWDASADDVGVTGYDLYRNGSLATTVTGTTYTDTALASATLYSYYLKARDAVGNESPASNTVSATTDAADIESPSTPTNLTVQSVNIDNVSLTWNPSTDNQGLAFYEILRDGQLVGTTATNAYIDTGLNPQTGYMYQVQAVDTSDNRSATSNSVFATTESGCSVTGANSLVLSDNKLQWLLTNDGLLSVTFSQIDISWPNAQGSIKKIRLGGDEIYRQELSPPSASINSGWRGNSSRRRIDIGVSDELEVEFNTSFTNDVEDDYTIQVSFAEGCSVLWAAAADTQSPTVPANLHQTGSTMDSVALAWDSSTDNVGVSGYDIFRNSNLLDTVTATSYTDTGLADDSSYDYDVVAFDAAGNRSGSSGTLTATTAAIDLEEPSAPTSLQVGSVGINSVDLTWNASTDNQFVAGYQIYRDGQLEGDTASTSYTSQGLSPATTYQYYVIAYDAAGNESNPGNTVNATTDAGGCSVSAANTLILGDNKIEWDITNTGAETITISSIEIAWPTEQGNLKKIKLDGDEIYRIQESPPGTVIDGNWRGNEDKREIDSGDTQRLKVEFTKKYKNDTQSDYALTVNFAQGCSVNF